MKRGLSIVVALTAVLWLGVGAARADYASAVKAYEAGEDVQALLEFKPLAEAGDTRAMSAVGHLLMLDDLPAKNYGESFEWFQRTLDAGDPYGHFGLGLHYKDGLGAPKDLLKALDHFLAAYEKGVLKGAYEAGNILWFERPKDAPMKPEQAFDLWLQAAWKGEYFSQDVIATQLYLGNRDEKSRTIAGAWWMLAEESGLWSIKMWSGGFRLAVKRKKFSNGDLILKNAKNIARAWSAGDMNPMMEIMGIKDEENLVWPPSLPHD